MADIIKTLDFNTLAVADPATPPTGYTKPTGSNNARIVNLTPKVFNMVGGATQALWYDNTVLSGPKISSTVVMSSTSGSSAGPCLVDSTGSGDGALQNDGQLRVYRFVNGQLGTQVGAAITNVNAAGDSITMEISDGVIKMFKNGVRIGGDYAKNSGVTHTFAGAFSRGAALRSMQSLYATAYTILTLTNPVTVGGAFSGTADGFTAGAGTLSYGGRSVACTFVGGTGGAISGTAAALVNAEVHPALPATAVVMTFAKGAESATINRDIPMLAGHAGCVFAEPMNTVNPKYITTAFANAGTPLVAGDRSYVPTAVTVHPNGLVEATAPVDNLPFWIHRVADNRTYAYTMAVNTSGEISISKLISSERNTGLNIIGRTIKGITV